jgi:hypothetical protein
MVIEVDSLDILVLVDNATDTLSSTPSHVESESAGLMRRFNFAQSRRLEAAALSQPLCQTVLSNFNKWKPLPHSRVLSDGHDCAGSRDRNRAGRSGLISNFSKVPVN